ncbi:thymopoietin isoform X7 [Pleurodeles waltl]|uniref:thymopoietin isoform X7 n=1 Tax=Pleurodeles waltl TaxID=8319 RepID=UPI003709AF31
MPEFLEDPSVLTKDKLKSELLANSVALPAGDQRKDVYVQLYRQHLTVRNKGKSRDFSSDEEREATPARSRPRKATKKTDKQRPEEKDDFDVTGLSNEDLKEELIKYGLKPGPIMGSTRKVYEKKLLKLKEDSDVPPAPHAVSSTAEESKQNGNTDSDQYSDDDDPEIILKLEKREPLKGRPKAQVNLRQIRVEQNQAHSEFEKYESRQVGNKVIGNFQQGASLLSASDFSELPRRTPKKTLTTEVLEKTATEERWSNKDILKEMFPYEASTPTGISVSCRRPIKGAAGRPVQLSEYKMEESYSAKYVPKYTALVDSKPQPTTKGRSLPVWIKILLFVLVAVFLFLVYQAMETNEGNPFAKYLL